MKQTSITGSSAPNYEATTTYGGLMADESSQSHPLHAIDRNIVDALLAAKEPNSEQLLNAARLFIRYEGFPGEADLKLDLEKLLRFWGLDRMELNSRFRELWASGYRPGQQNNEAVSPVGSGFDSTDSENDV
jgi:hypothetical protein